MACRCIAYALYEISHLGVWGMKMKQALWDEIHLKSHIQQMSVARGNIFVFPIQKFVLSPVPDKRGLSGTGLSCK